jgi:hypothetical protein
VRQGVRDDGFGLTAFIEVPGGAGGMMRYQPRHPSAVDLD